MSNVGLSFAVHYLSFIVVVAVLLCDLAYVDLPNHHTYAGRFKYLTFISFLCDILYFNMASIIDFQVWMKGKDNALWRNIRDFFFATIIFPLATFVCVMFWGIHLLDSTALRSDEENTLLPWWFDHGYHTVPIFAVFLEAYVIEHIYPRKRTAFLSLLVFDILYVSWLFWIAYKANFWVYPFLSRMSFVGVLLFVAVSVTISFGFYFVGKKFTDIVWENNKRKAF